MKKILGILLIISSSFSSPSQFITKVYTEGLGRAPDQPGWRYFMDYLDNNNHSNNAYRQVGLAVFTSAEFQSLNYNGAQRAITLYRAALNRDPDNASIQNWITILNDPNTNFSDIVNFFFSCNEFLALLPDYRDPDPHFWNQNSFTNFAIPINHANSDPSCNRLFQGGTQGDLQNMLNLANPGNETVCLAENETVFITSTLIIPAGVRLKTHGNLNRNQYAKFGRLIRWQNNMNIWVMIQMNSGSRIENIWLDGQETAIGRLGRPSWNLRINGGNNTSVRESRFSASPSGTNIEIWGADQGFACTNVSITDNLITSYTSDHPEPTVGDEWNDGISTHCESTIISGNHVIESTDVGIIVFGHSVQQRSQVRNNVVFNSANSAFAALMIEPTRLNTNFSGTVFENNILWTGPNAHFDVGLMVGIKPWSRNPYPTGRNPIFRNNITGTEEINCNIAILVTDMTNATVTGNNLRTRIINTTDLPLSNIVTNNVTGGNIQGPSVNVPNNQIQGEIPH